MPVSGPIASSVAAAELMANHVVIDAAESPIAGLARGTWSRGPARTGYRAVERLGACRK